MHVSHLPTLRRVLIALALLGLILGLIPPAVVAAPPQEGTIIYTVQFGDTLFSISRRFGTTVEAIMTANGLYTDYIFVGQRLVIPVGVPPAPPANGFGCKYIVQPRDTVFSVAYRYQTSVDTLMRSNYLYSPFIYAGRVLNVPCITPAPSPFPIYVIQPGDSLFRVAIRYNTTVYAIALVNGIPNPSVVYVGQSVIIPYAGTVPWPAVPTVYPYPSAEPTPGPMPTFGPTPEGSVCTENCVVIMQPQANRFEPQTLTIARNVTVTWMNIDTITHTVTSGIGGPNNIFQSPPMPSNSVYSFNFSSPGTFPYFDEYQGSAMNGTIIVQ